MFNSPADIADVLCEQFDAVLELGLANAPQVMHRRYIRDEINKRTGNDPKYMAEEVAATMTIDISAGVYEEYYDDVLRVTDRMIDIIIQAFDLYHAEFPTAMNGPHSHMVFSSLMNGINLKFA